MELLDKSILCIGDLMLDRLVRGDVDRISPEAPVPVLKLRESQAGLGGVGNVAHNVVALGGRAVLIGLVGVDALAQELTSLIAAKPGIVDAKIASRSRPTTCKSRFFAAGQQVIRVDDEVVRPAAPAEANQLLREMERSIGSADAVILSDYGKGALTPEVIAFAISKAQALGIPVFVDPKGADFRRYRGATCITPNVGELAAASGRSCQTDEEIVDTAVQLLKTAEAEAILVTRSERGMTLVEKNGAVTSVQASAKEVFDVSGAGDTAIATLALCHASGASLATAMRVANAAAGVVVSKVGTAAVSRSELADALERQESFTKAVPSSLLSGRDAVAVVSRWRRFGLTCGFTNGCFDILHTGHISLLQQARGQCNRLIVGLNSDESVRRLKGPDRPVNTLENRAAALAAIRFVDAVVAFRENTPAALIELLRPDVLIKGSDYTVDEVVGADFVRANGGRVFLAEFVAQQSTTKLINKLRRGGGVVADALLPG